jgi:hypothetical protein
MIKQYTYNCREHKKNAIDIVKWMRRNFGSRSEGWDFLYITSTDTLYITLSNDKYIVEWELVYE